MTGRRCSSPAENRALLRPEQEPAIKALFPARRNRRGSTMPGHWVHAEQPEAFLALVEPFLAS